MEKNIKLGVIPIINYITENNKDNFNNVLNEYTNLLKFLDSSYMIGFEIIFIKF